MTDTESPLINLDDLTVGDLIQIETELAALLPSTPTKPGITAETLKEIMKGE